MKSPILTTIGLLAALAGIGLAHARTLEPDRSARSTVRQGEGHSGRQDDRHDDRNRSARSSSPRTVGAGMQPVLTTAGPGEPGHGWRYFTDPAAATAVVISPQGEHFVNRGEGLRLVDVAPSTP